MAGVTDAGISADSLRVEFIENEFDRTALLSKLLSEGLKVVEFGEESRSLEDIFLKLTE